MSTASKALQAAYSVLASGDWVEVRGVLNAAMRAVPPGEAYRAAVAFRQRYMTAERIAEIGEDELIRSGRREIARQAIVNAVESGRIVANVPLPLGKAVWSGEVAAMLRDSKAGLLSVARAAEDLGITSALLHRWIDAGYVPRPSDVLNAGEMGVTADDLAIYRRVRAAWPGPAKHWPADPRSYWKAPCCTDCGAELVCPAACGAPPSSSGEARPALPPSPD